MGGARIALGQVRVERARRQMARAAAGLQCNGPAAGSGYGPLNGNAITFHDHRMREADLVAARAVQRSSDGPLTVAFSGRLTTSQGALDVMNMAEILIERGSAARVLVYGTGELESRMRAMRLPNVEFRGFLDLETEWKQEVRETVDVFLFPHPHGDPSCTYFEALGSGVPILGYRNETLSPLVAEHRVGWEVPRGDYTRLADMVIRLERDRAAVSIARDAALVFMADRSHESTVRLRRDHLLSVI